MSDTLKKILVILNADFILKKMTAIMKNLLNVITAL